MVMIVLVVVGVVKSMNNDVRGGRCGGCWCGGG